MKLQVSFDVTDLKKALHVASQIVDYVDIFELGTLLIYKYGIEAIRQFKEAFPETTILIDSKIVDRGKEAATIFAHANADWVTVMAGTSKEVIHSVSSAAHSFNKKVMLDLLDSASVGQSALEAKNLGLDALLFHQPYDAAESIVFLEQWDMVKGNSALPVFVSAKINRENIQDVLKIKPDGIIIGSSIVNVENPREEAEFFYKTIFSSTSE
jgi:3-hexulose-6-phosphate synthase